MFLKFVFILLLFSTQILANDLASLGPYVDPNIDPCRNFYLFACGSWLKSNPIPASRSSHDRFDEVRQRNQQTLKILLEKASAINIDRSPLDQKLGDLYSSCMDENRIEDQGIEAIRSELNKISSINSVESLAELTGVFHRMNIRVLFQFRPTSEADGSLMVAELRQSGLGLPDRDYYTGDDLTSTSLRESYLNHIKRTLELSGENSENAAKGAQSILEIETALAHKSLTNHKLQSRDRTIHKLTLKKVQSLTPSFTWDQYLITVQSPSFDFVIVTPPEFFSEIENLIQSRPIEDWKYYFRWHLLHFFSPYLSADFQEERAQFYEFRLNGSIENKPRWLRCVDFTESSLGDALGKKFVDETLTEKGRNRLTDMIQALKKSIGKKIEELSWFSEETRKEALIKLSEIEGRMRIDYPEARFSYEKVKIVRDNWIANVISTQQSIFERQLGRIGKPVNRREWRISPSSTNAFYNPALNEIVLTAGILQPPFFDENADDAANFGAIGAIIAHELTHAFDENGRNFDAKGNPRDWWTESDRKEFASRAACFIEQYGKYRAGGLYNMNGHLTLSENIADHGGLRFAYDAYSDQRKDSESADSDNPQERRFFLSWAQMWCENQTDEWTRMRVMDDIHSLGWYRTNGVVGALPEFGTAFSCAEDSSMIQTDPCRVW